MSKTSETSSLRSIFAEVAGLVFTAAGTLVALLALGAIHPLLSSAAAVVGSAVLYGYLVPPRTRLARVLASIQFAIVTGAALGCAFAYFPPLGWLEVGAILASAGVWLASEGA
ncbi:hypothetical protein [Streptomyces sp. NPDC058657]|uniref:hypothetical protein n=1 Tax=unclassified Streptomyces TaxID=2593676 RepID=UPI00364E8078